MADPPPKAPAHGNTVFPTFHVHFSARSPMADDQKKAATVTGDLSADGMWIYVYDFKAKKDERLTEWMTDASGNAFDPEHVGDQKHMLELTVGEQYGVHHAHVSLSDEERAAVEAAFEPGVALVAAGKPVASKDTAFVVRPTPADAKTGIRLPSCFDLSELLWTAYDGVEKRTLAGAPETVFFRGRLAVDVDGAPNCYAFTPHTGRQYMVNDFAMFYEKGEFVRARADTVLELQRLDEAHAKAMTEWGKSEKKRKEEWDKQKKDWDDKKKDYDKKKAEWDKLGDTEKAKTKPPAPLAPLPDFKATDAPAEDPKAPKDRATIAAWRAAVTDEILGKLIVDTSGKELNRLPSPASEPLDAISVAVFHFEDDPPHWSGVDHDEKGRPYVQGDGPYKDFFIATTRLGKEVGADVPAHDPRHYLNAMEEAFMSNDLPRRKANQVAHDVINGLTGDFAVVCRKPSPTEDILIAKAVVADIGGTKTGEVSARTAQLVGAFPKGMPKNIHQVNAGSEEINRTAYVVFKDTKLLKKNGNARAPTVEEVEANVTRLFEAWGGVSRLRCCFPELFYVKPKAEAKKGKGK